MEDSTIAVFDNALSIKSHRDYLSCAIVDIPKRYFPVQMAYTIQKDSPFRAAFTYHIKQLKESGIVDRIKARYEIKDQICPNNIGKPLKYSQCVSAFALMLGGGGMSIVWLL